MGKGQVDKSRVNRRRLISVIKKNEKECIAHLKRYQSDDESARKRGSISGAQVRAARAFLGWTARALAKNANVPDFTLEWIEGHGRISGKDLKGLAAIQAQLETAGIEFTDDEGIPGLRLHPRERESKGRAASPRRASLT